MMSSVVQVQDEKRSDDETPLEADWQLRALALTGMIFSSLFAAGYVEMFRLKVLERPASWSNPLYADEHAFVYYFIHFVTFTLFMFGGPFILQKWFNTPRIGLYWVLWFAAAILTVIPLLGVQRSAETFGSGVTRVSGVAANAAQLIFVLYFIIAYVRRQAIKRSVFYAFHAICGFNVCFLPFKYALADQPDTNAAVGWSILAFTLAFAVQIVFSRPFAHSPKTERISWSMMNWAVIAMISLCFSAVPIAWYASCDLCGKGE